MIWATDEKTGETALKEVVQLFRNETKEWIHVKVNDEEITCTPEHPFYSPVKGWTSAIDLRAGDILVMLNGEYVVVEQVQHEILEIPETTYNFEVADFHTYYVGKEPILVHNTCVNQMNKQIKSGKAPKEVIRIDNPNSSVPNSQIHAHFKDGTSLNIDGTIHDAHKGLPHLTNSITRWLRKYGWKI